MSKVNQLLEAIAQFEGKTIGDLILNPRHDIEASEANSFLERVIAL